MMDEMKMNPTSEKFPQELIDFGRKWDAKNPTKSSALNHNLYILRTTDMAGNVTGEAYGMNLMTNYGFDCAYSYGGNNSYSSLHLFIGEGTNTPSFENKALFQPIVTYSSTDTNINMTYYGITYDKENDTVSLRARMYEGYFDYNLTDITEEKTITEIGYGPSYNNLWTHAQVFDADGNLGGIVKRPNERLTITMFWSLKFKPEFIRAAYDRGILMCFSPHIFLIRHDTLHFYQYYIKNGKHDDRNSANGSLEWFGREDTVSDVIDNVITCQTTIGDKFVDGSMNYVSNIYLLIGTDSYWSESGRYNDNYFILITRPKLSTPERIEYESVYTNSYSSSYFDYMFGRYVSDTGKYPDGRIPVNDFTIESLHMYNHLTKEWDIQESLTNPNESGLVDYNTNFLGYTGVWTYIKHLDETRNAFIFINMRNDIPITSFGNSGMTVYATDEYWDTDSWKVIPNIKQIPTELQTKKYYISLTEPSYQSNERQGRDTYTLYDTRDQAYPCIQTMESSKIITVNHSSTSTAYYGGKPLSNNDYGYIIATNCITYPDSDMGDGKPYSYLLRGPNNQMPHGYLRWDFTNGNKIVTIGTSGNTIFNNIRVYTMSNDPSVEPIYEDHTCDFSTTVTSNLYWSGSKNGFVILQRLDGTNEAVIFDMYSGEDGNTVTKEFISNVRFCHALDLSDNCVYLTSDPDNLRLEIYDMKNKTVVDEFIIPDNTCTVDGIAGWKEHIYVRVNSGGTYSTYYYNTIEKRVIHLTAMNIPAMTSDGNSFQYHQQYCVDECMVIGGYRSSDGNLHNVRVIKYDDPTNAISLFPDSLDGTFGRTYLVYGQLGYVNDGKQLVFTGTSSASFMYCIDIGHIIDTGQPIQDYYRGRFYYDRGRARMIGLFKNRVYINTEINEYPSGSYYDRYDTIRLDPVENYLPHKIVGTTYTINSFNNPVQIGSRTYSLKITNDSSKWE